MYFLFKKLGDFPAIAMWSERFTGAFQSLPFSPSRTPGTHQLPTSNFAPFRADHPNRKVPSLAFIQREEESETYEMKIFFGGIYWIHSFHITIYNIRFFWNSHGFFWGFKKALLPLKRSSELWSKTSRFESPPNETAPSKWHLCHKVYIQRSFRHLTKLQVNWKFPWFRSQADEELVANNSHENPAF